MANEFIARKGLISSGSIKVSGSVSASYFVGDGSQLINLPGGATALSIDTYTFQGNGSTVNYVLSQSYNINSLVVSVDGLTQTSVIDYSLAGATLTFVSTPPSESNVLIRALVSVTENVTGSFSGSFFGNIASASFATSASYVQPSGLPSGIVSASSQISIVADNHAFVGDGTTTIYTLSQSYSPAILTVSIDGLVNTLTEDYTVSTNQLTLVSAPPSSSNILVKGIRIALI